MEETEGDEDMLCMANEILIRFGRKPYVKCLKDCDHGYFVDVYEAMVGEPLLGLNPLPESIEGKIHNVQVVIDSLASDVLGIDISHVSAQMVVNKDKEHVRCLLEIFNGLLEFLMEELTGDVEVNIRAADDNLQEVADNSADSDKLDDNHEILSDVLHKEFGQSYPKISGNQKKFSKKPPTASSYPKKSYMPTKDIGDSVTWKSGNGSHTVGWSDSQLIGALSPSGESTATDDLLCLAQSTGNSTDELIKEAQSVQMELEASRCSRDDSKLLHRNGEAKEDNSIPFSGDWSTILSKTSSAVEDISANREVEPKPQKKPAFQKEKELKNCKPMVLQSQLGCTDSSVLFDLSSHPYRLPEMTADSLQTTNKTFSINGDNSSLEDNSNRPVDSPPRKQCKKISQRGRSRERKSNSYDGDMKSRPAKPGNHKNKTSGINKKRSTEISVSSKTLKDVGHRKTSTLPNKEHKEPIMENGGITQITILKDDGNIKKTTIDQEKTSTVEANHCEKPLTQEHNGFKETDTVTDGDKTESVESVNNVALAPSNDVSSTININEIVDPSSFLTDEKTDNNSSVGLKIQTNLSLPDYSTDSRSKQLSDLSERLKKLREQVNPTIATISSTVAGDTTQQSHIMNKEKKDKVKVSFNMDSLLEEYHYSMSDTEIDYGSPKMQTDGDQNHVCGRRGYLYQGQGKTSRRSILRSKINQTDSSTSTNETTGGPEDITTKFEKPFLRRDERLHKLKKCLRVQEKENKHEVKKLRNQYTIHHGKLKEQEKMVKRQSNLISKQRRKNEKDLVQFDTTVPGVQKSPGLKKVPVNKYAAKLTAIYGSGSPQKVLNTSQGTKRSASASPVGRRRYKTPMVLEEHEILPVMEDEFPFIHLSPHTAKLMWQKQLRQINNLSKHTKPHKTSKIQKAIEDAQKKQKALAEVMKKEIEHNRRLKELKERKDEETVVRRNLQERRQRSARARRYYNEYAVQNKARMLKKRTKEEKIFKQLFEDGLEIQKQRIKEMRDYAREQKEKNAKKQKDEIESLENFYRDKFACLAESVAEEKYELEVRQRAQAKVLDKMRCGMRKRMETDLKDIQEQLQNDEDAYYFRQLDADVLKKEFQLATYRI